ncbi:sentrin-specific protease 6-like [Dendronephthya gigantea]|uniref:sentrin-specific protease 6-like n=1 Tax=Dendronephthya gigantea TaxID=151771 RepID=UPI00106C4F94|nr:sentrin-specific protease 6-like [Dendronephthya gigantea]
MSLLSSLDVHEKDPTKNWGRYSRSTSVKFGDISETPEDDTVQLVEFPPETSTMTRRSALRKLRQKPIEINDDQNHDKLKSDTDRNPMDFNARESDFVIPKTKKQTQSEKEQKTSATRDSIRGKWITRQNGVTSYRVRTQIPLKPGAEGRTKSKKRANVSDDESPRKSIRRSWMYDQSSEDKAQKQHDGFRASKPSKDESSRDKGCSTCPESDSEYIAGDEFNSSQDESSEERKERTIKEAKRTDDGKKTEEEGMRCEPISIASSSSQDGDSITSLPKSEVTQNDLFCEACLAPFTRDGCCCETQQTLQETKQHSTGNSRSTNVRNLRYSGIKYGDVSAVGKGLNTKRKRKSKTLALNKINTSGRPLSTLTFEYKTRGKTAGAKEPVPVQCIVSSDEDESHNVTDEVEENETITNDNTNTFDDDENKMFEAIKRRNSCGVVGGKNKETAALYKISCEYDDSDVGESTSFVLDKPEKKQQKQKKSSSFAQVEDTCVRIAVKRVFIGDLSRVTSELVEVTDDRILIQIRSPNETLDFHLERESFSTFEIHNDDEPRVIIMKPTPYWARRCVERYRNYGTFIDPGSCMYSKRQILLELAEKISPKTFKQLIQLVNYKLSDEPIAEEISMSEAKEERERIMKDIKELKSQSTSSENTNTTKNFPVVKTYGTRSKSNPTSVKTPPKTVLVRVAGVTITNKDFQCLDPSTYLNDIIMEFFLKYIIEEKLNADDRDRIHLFSTYFYEKLTQKNRNSNEQRSPTSMHSMVKSWTKNVDIFSKDFLFIPINESSHWFLVAICYPMLVVENAETEDNSGTQLPESQTDESDMDDFDKELWRIAKASSAPVEEIDVGRSKESEMDDFARPLIETAKTCIEEKDTGKMAATSQTTKRRKKSREITSGIKKRPCILIFDSLGSCHRATVMSNLRNYLNCEWKAKKDCSSKVVFDKDTIKGCYPKVPSQENFSDCGLYVLQYFESFFINPIKDYKFPIDLRSWFGQDEMRKKRLHIKNVILKLQARAESLNSN